MAIGLTDSEYIRFRDWLASEFGLVFGPEKRDILRSRLEPMRLHLGVDTFEEVLFSLKFNPLRDQHRQMLISHVTNNESYFFRETGQLEHFRDEALPEIIDRAKARNQHDIRILSAGCAAGEEPYTIAMMLKASGQVSKGMKVRITGADLDPEALQRARAGEYGENAFRRIDPLKRQKFFRQTEGGRWELVPEIREMVTFEQINLAQRGWGSKVALQDAIFCRNVLIYFDKDSMQRVIDAFYDQLRPGGYLFLGHSESLSRVTSRFEPVRRPGSLSYRRAEEGNE